MKDDLIDMAGLMMRRSELAAIVSDLDRFERCLPDALMVNRDMQSNGGEPPAYTYDWPEMRRYECVLTMQEIGVLKMRAEAQAAPESAH